MHIAAAFPKRRTQRSNASASGALLLPKFSTGAGYVTPGLGSRGALTAIRQVIANRGMHERLVEGYAKHGVRQFEVADLFVL